MYTEGVPARWYCASALATTAVAFAAANLANQHFDSFCPLELTDRGARPLFGSYFFVQFDVDRDRWRSILGTRGVKTILGLMAERPRPLAIGIVEDLQRRAQAGEFDSRKIMTEKPGSIEPDTAIRCGHFEGVVKLDMGSRVRVLLNVFGGMKEHIVKRDQLEIAA